MAQFIAFEKNIMVNGATILSVLKGMGKHKEMGEDILEENGISDIKPEQWYSQQAWLDSFKAIAEEIGEATLFNIGKAILESAQFPPHIDTIDKGLATIDIAYHMNHQKNGEAMFNPETGKMLEGIGHYKYESIEEGFAKVTGETPYPCEFDKGIVTAMARKFKSMAEVQLDSNAPQKKSGADTSTYLVQW